MNKEETRAVNTIKTPNKKIRECKELENPFEKGKMKRIELILSAKDWNMFEIIINLINEKKKEIEDWKFTTKYVEENYVSKDRIKKDLKTCEQVYEREMKPYQKEYGLDVTYLSKKEKEKLINTRNCLIAQMETYKQLLGGIKWEQNTQKKWTIT